MDIINSITIKINNETKTYYEWSSGECECKTVRFDNEGEIISTNNETFKNIDEMKANLLNSLEFNLEWDLK